MSPVLDDYLISLSGDSTVNTLYVGQDFTINSPLLILLNRGFEY